MLLCCSTMTVTTISEFGRIIRLLLGLSFVGYVTSFVPQNNLRRAEAAARCLGSSLSKDSPPNRVLISPNPSSPPSVSSMTYYRVPAAERDEQKCDVVVVGGALAGLSAALYLSQMDPSRQITILDREDYGKPGGTVGKKSGNAQPASFAAAGMLAPQSERLPPGPLLDLCVASRGMYPAFCRMVESLARESGQDGAPYLFHNQFPQQQDVRDDATRDPYSVGYAAAGGFLAPAFAGDAVATWAPPSDSGSAIWLDAMQVRDIEPVLHPDVIGAWWFPDDASVDARRLTCTLRAACVAAGITFWTGPQYEVSSLDLVDGTCRGLWLRSSSTTSSNPPQQQPQRYISTQTVLVANGAWMRQLLPVPIEPHKGQSLALRMPPDRPPILSRVLFAQDTYIVPRAADGRIVIGATVEAGSYDPNVTPAGLLHILTHALQLVPALKDLPIDETWAGLRPTTPDKAPILGKSRWNNLFVAGGYWRNGVLLAPKTGQLLAKLIVCSSRGDSSSDDDNDSLLDPQDMAFLKAFAWDRFTTPAGSKTIAANARYAASMHPIHRRSSTGNGVSAAVGTELGVYSSARSAREERRQDRESLWAAGSKDADAAFERAAALGKEDALAYNLHDETDEVYTSSYFEGAADALTIGVATSENEKESITSVAVDGNDSSTQTAIEELSPVQFTDEIAELYERIKANKAKHGATLPESIVEEDRPDPGFRVYHVDPTTGETREVPPYTSPGEFLASISLDDKISSNPSLVSSKPSASDEKSTANGYNETTYDGYQEIQQANSRKTRTEELNAMREARRINRLGQDEIDISKIGAQRMD
jgi:glycine/D-amino acid oxidase-like deaminating enzyme